MCTRTNFLYLLFVVICCFVYVRLSAKSAIGFVLPHHGSERKREKRAQVSMEQLMRKFLHHVEPDNPTLNQFCLNLNFLDFGHNNNTSTFNCVSQKKLCKTEPHHKSISRETGAGVRVLGWAVQPAPGPAVPGQGGSVAGSTQTFSVLAKVPASDMELDVVPRAES